MKIFITGASGFLGQHLLPVLQAEGHQLTLLLRSPEQAQALQQQGHATVIGTLGNIPDWQPQLAGHDVCIHLAAPLDFWGRWRQMKRDIADATLALYQASNEYKLKRFIYISSESVLQNETPLLDIDEYFPYQKPDSLYGRGKQLAEQYLLAANGDTECIILRPTCIWGKDVALLNDIQGKINKGQFMWLDHGNTVIESVHVKNVVEAIRLSLTEGRNKNIYFVTDDNPQTIREFFSKLLATRGLVAPDKNLSKGLARILARGLDRLWRILHLPFAPPLSHFEWSFVALPRRYKIDKIKNDMGYRPVVSEAEGLAEMST